MTFDQTAWDNLYYSYRTENISEFNVLFAEFIDQLVKNREQYDAAVSILEGYFYGGDRSQVFSSVCALRRLEPNSAKVNEMLLAASIASGRWDVVIRVAWQSLTDASVRGAMVSSLAIWWPTLSLEAPVVFLELLCRVIADAKVSSFNGEDHLYAFARTLLGEHVSGAVLDELARPQYGTRAVALIGHIYQERYEWTKALSIWSEISALEPDFPGIEALIIRSIENIAPSWGGIAEIASECSKNIQQAIMRTRYRNFVVLENRRAVYRVNPKVGATAILSRIWAANGGLGTPNLDIVHDDELILRRLDKEPPERIDEIMNSPDWTRFSFVRDPVRRFVSGFLNKCTRLHLAIPAYMPFLRAVGLSAGIPASAPIETRDDYHFEQMVWFVEQRSPYDLDMHFAPQTVVLDTARVRYQFIGRLETFQQDLESLSDLIGVDLRNPGQSLHRTDSDAFSKDLVEGDLMRRLREYFREDVRQFGYAEDRLSSEES
jgi:hypothetical protein